MPTTYPGTVYVSGATRLGFGRENNFSQLVQPTRFLGLTNQGLDFPDRVEDIRQFRTFGFGPQYFTSRFGARDHQSSLTFVPTTAEMFYYVMGQDTKVAGSGPGGFSDPHIMEPVEAAYLPSMSLWGAMVGAPNFTRYFPGLVIGGFQASLSEGQELTLSIDVMARGGFADLTPTAPLTPAGRLTDDGSGNPPTPYMFYDRDALISVMGSYDPTNHALTGGRPIATVKSFNFTHARGLHPIRTFVAASLPVGGQVMPDNPASLWVAGQMPDDPRHPLVFVTAGAETTLSMDVVPRGTSASVGGGRDAIIDMIQNETTGDILIPFKRFRADGSFDTLDFVFEDCKIQRGNHPWADDRGETVVSVNVIVNRFRIYAKDKIQNYGTV